MEPAKKLHPSLPENYVSLLDLRERWMKQQKQKEREECDRDKEVQPIVGVQDDLGRADVGGDKGAVGDDQLGRNQPVKKSVFESNPNPKAALRKPSYDRSRPADTRNCRWVQVCQSKPPLASPRNQPEQTQVATTMQPKPAPVAREVEQKAVPVHLESKSKPPPMKAPKIESVIVPCGETRGSGEKADDQKHDREKMEVKNRVGTMRKRRHQKKKNVVESQPEKIALPPNDDLQEKKEISERVVAAAGGKKIVNDLPKAGIEDKLEVLSLNGGTGVSSSRRSKAVRNPRRGTKDVNYGKFEHMVILKKERARREGVGVWVKKGEVSVMGAAPVEKTSSIRA